MKIKHLKMVWKDCHAQGFYSAEVITKFQLINQINFNSAYNILEIILLFQFLHVISIAEACQVHS